MIWEKRPYTNIALEYALSRNRSGLLLKPGLGKTAISLEVYRILRERFDANRVLVVAPLSVCYLTWPVELKKWDQFRGLTMHILHGPGKEFAIRSKADIYLINPAGLKWLAKQKWNVPDMLIVDEMTRFKHHTTAQAKNLRRIIDQGEIKTRIGLTGTPAPNGLEDLFGEALMLDDGVVLGESLRQFRERFWFAPHPDGQGHYNWGPTTRSEDLLYEALKPLMLRLDGKGEIKEAEVITTDVPVALPDEARAHYTELKKEMILSLERGDVVAMNAGALISKCRQLASGSVYITKTGQMTDKATRTVQKIHEAKLERLAERWEEAGQEPMLVGYDMRHSKDAIVAYMKKHYKLTVPFIGGGVKPTDIKRIVDEWNAGKHPMLLGHPLSMGHGLNLQLGGANRIVWYDPTWDLELYDQFNARLNRQGQTSGFVFIDHLVAERTVDQTIVRAIRRKTSDQDRLLAALREEIVCQSSTVI